LFDEEELLGLLVEPFQEEFVGVIGGFAAVGTGVEGFERHVAKFFVQNKSIFILSNI
jgi:hypothetical protein